MIFRLPSIALQTAHVFTFLPDEAPSGGGLQPSNLLDRRLLIADRVRRRLLHEQLDARRELLADVEAQRPLTVVPVEAIPVRPVARSGWRALFAASFPAAHVLLAVDDPAWTITRLGCAARLSQRHAQALHKTMWSGRNLLRRLGW
jgi:hypothetical protein